MWRDVPIAVAVCHVERRSRLGRAEPECSTTHARRDPPSALPGALSVWLRVGLIAGGAGACLARRSYVGGRGGEVSARSRDSDEHETGLTFVGAATARDPESRGVRARHTAAFDKPERWETVIARDRRSRYYLSGSSLPRPTLTRTG